MRVISKLPSIEDRQYELALEAPEVKAALFEHEAAQARRDSISRKLCGGSSAVTVRWEGALAKAREALMQLARCRPILERHPIIASALTHS